MQKIIDNIEEGIKRGKENARLKSEAVQNAEAVGKYLARKYWDGLHDHPQASHCRDLEFEQYYELNKDGYTGEAQGLIDVIRGEHFKESTGLNPVQKNVDRKHNCRYLSMHPKCNEKDCPIKGGLDEGSGGPKNMVGLAAEYLENAHISGDTMVALDHNVETGKGGAMYLHDLMAGFVNYLRRMSWISKTKYKH